MNGLQTTTTVRRQGLGVLATGLVAILTASAEAQLYFGLDHTADDAAVLTPQPDGKLKVSNLGSSGCDGFSVDLGETGGVQIEVDVGPAGALGAGSCVEVYHPYDWRNGCIYVKESSGGSAVAGIGGTGQEPTSVRVDLFSNGALVDTVVHVAPYPGNLVVGNIGSSGKDGVRMNLDVRPTLYVYTLECPSQQLLTLTGSALGPILADAVTFTLDGLPPGEPVRGLVARFADMPNGEVMVHGEALLQQLYSGTIGVLDGEGHATCSAVGGSSMVGIYGPNICETHPEWCDGANQGALTISNIGSSGCDGVRVDWDFHVDSFFDIYLDAVDPDSDGDEVHLEGRGTVAGIADTFLGSLELRNVLGDIELAADYTALGATEVTVEVHSHGTFVGSAQIGGGTGSGLGTLLAGPGGLGINKCGKLGGLFSPPCFTTCTDNDFTFIGGGQVFVGNELRVLAVGAPDPIDRLSSFTVAGAGIGPFTSAVAIPCKSDVSPNRSVDVGDLLQVLASWGTGGPGARIAPDDTITDVADLLKVLADWGPCP